MEGVTTRLAWKRPAHERGAPNNRRRYSLTSREEKPAEAVDKELLR